MADFLRRVPLDELRGRGLMRGLQPEVLEQISSWPSAHAHGDELCTQLIARTIAKERWRPGYVPASSQEVCRRFGSLDFREAVSMQRLRLAARLVNASPSLMALLQSDAGRA